MGSVCPLGVPTVRLCREDFRPGASRKTVPGKMEDLNEYKRNKYAQERPNLYPKEPENCNHPEEAQQEVQDDIGEVTKLHSTFTECTECGARIPEDEL